MAFVSKETGHTSRIFPLTITMFLVLLKQELDTVQFLHARSEKPVPTVRLINSCFCKFLLRKKELKLLPSNILIFCSRVVQICLITAIPFLNFCLEGQTLFYFLPFNMSLHAYFLSDFKISGLLYL